MKSAYQPDDPSGWADGVPAIQGAMRVMSPVEASKKMIHRVKQKSKSPQTTVHLSAKAFRFSFMVVPPYLRAEDPVNPRVSDLGSLEPIPSNVARTCLRPARPWLSTLWTQR